MNFSSFSYEYRTADALVKDIELMKNNAVKFNSQASPIALEAIAMAEYVRDQVESHREEISALEEAVRDQMTAKPKKRAMKGWSSKKSSSDQTTNVGGVDVNLGDLSKSMNLGNGGSDSDDSFLDLYND
jgi:hypothetical protein